LADQQAPLDEAGNPAPDSSAQTPLNDQPTTPPDPTVVTPAPVTPPVILPLVPPASVTPPLAPTAVTAPIAVSSPTARGRLWTQILITGALLVAGWLLYARTGNGGDQPYQLWGVYAVVVLLAIASAATGRFWPTKLVEGSDGRLSVSKAQVAVWTAAVAYSYVTLYAARAFQAHDVHPIDTIPQNILIVLGISAASAVGAKAITVSKISSNQIQKTDKEPGSASLADLVAGDDNCPDINKVQLLFWTAVSVVVYVSLTNGALQHYFASLDCTTAPPAGNPLTALSLMRAGHDLNCLALPNIDAVLMVLMGLSHGTYLGGKLTQADLPRVSSVTPLSGPPGTAVVLQGVDFGTVLGSIFLDNRPYWGSSTSIAWDDNKISFNWPDKDADASDWVSGRSVAITIVTGGQTAQGAASFTVR
jgi:hypothetical protein